MEREVIIKLKIDPTEYYDAENTPSGTIDLVHECLKGEADFAGAKMEITCEGVTKKVEIA